MENGASVPSASTMNGVSSHHILYVDAYDSFSNNIISMLEENLNVKVTVLTVDSEWPNGDMYQFLRQFDAVVLGPGPGNPEFGPDVGIMRDFWTLPEAELVPVLGICLGFQSLCLHHGVQIQRLPCPLHGQVRRISTVNEDIFKGMEDFEVTLYNSLYAAVDGMQGRVPQNGESSESMDGSHFQGKDLSFLAWLPISEHASKAIPMAVRHNEKPFWGVQFHPESCKSDASSCTKLLKRWWEASTAFNKQSGRLIHPNKPKVADPCSFMPAIDPEIQDLLEGLTAPSSEKCAFRSLPLHDLSAEKIFEMANTPGSPSVLFQSNGRFNVMSTLSPNSWRLEYYVPSKSLLVEDLGDAACRRYGDPAQKALQTLLDVGEFWNTLKHLLGKKKVTSGNNKVPFWGGFLGYFSYEMGLAGLAHPKTSPHIPVENHPAQQTDPPDVSLLWVERSIVIDNMSRTVYIQSTRKLDDQQDGWLDMIHRRLQDFACAHSLEAKKRIASTNSKFIEADCHSLLEPAETELVSYMLERATVDIPDEEDYKSQIAACKSQLEAGESYELCLTGETSITLPALPDETLRKLRPWLLYKKLKTYNPAAFSAYARLGKVKVASSSPECFLNWDRESTLEMKPMKGTVKKSADMTLEKAKAILSTTKEMAENLMIADLVRHDLYGICGSGNVHVEKLLEVEDHGRVYQMITHVKGVVNALQESAPHQGPRQMGEPGNMSSYGITALQRCLPPGSMTGAPKERSCMHLEAIEGRKRGIYSGVMGFLDLGGGGSFSVLIRTAFSCSDDNAPEQGQEELWRVGAGGAVTILSTADGEWDEMMTKLRTVVSIFTPGK
jgi:para-aminobenzoate synthetase